MRKYWASFRIHLQTMVIYRGPILVWLFGNCLSLVVMIAVWLSASAGQTIGGYTKSELVTYYIAALFLQWLVFWHPFNNIKEEIRNGEIVVNTLVKPISYFWQKFAEEVSWHLVSSFVGLLATFVFMFWLQDYIVLNFVSLEKWLLLISAIILAILVTFTFSFCLGFLAFWLTEIVAIDSFYWVARLTLGGQGVPISFLPGFFQDLVRLLPFRYMFSFPLEVYFGKLSNNEIIQGLIMQLFWMVVFVQLYKLMWSRGRKAYGAFGQ